MSRATIVGVGVLLTAWVFLSVAVWQATALLAGWDVAERLVPYANAHLLEEAADGLYEPWRDPVFLFGVIANSVVPVAIATLVASRLHARAPLAVIGVGVLALMVINRHVFASGFPLAVRIAFLLEVCAVIAGGLSTAAAFRTNRPASRGTA
jgi:hypothetical protein